LICSKQWKKIQHCRNNFKIKYKNRRKCQHRYHWIFLLKSSSDIVNILQNVGQYDGCQAHYDVTYENNNVIHYH
jgi:DNA-binding transcriptional regulator WhiA